MARELKRGEIWLYAFKAPDKRRPVLIISRQAALRFLRTALIAPVTSTIHGSPAEVLVGVAEGLKHPSAVNLDHVQTVEQSLLHQFIGTVDADTMRRVCRALAVATGCA
ncbi:MAG: type II toxin-antitoxin system PemK/MazF family toxin [Spirochaetaceae bacterium]|nr:type II toxin-antitoxin system PemK/MazF family toxin [Spirochaetaceae bacterium]